MQMALPPLSRRFPSHPFFYSLPPFKTLQYPFHTFSFPFLFFVASSALHCSALLCFFCLCFCVWLDWEEDGCVRQASSGSSSFGFGRQKMGHCRNPTQGVLLLNALSEAHHHHHRHQATSPREASDRRGGGSRGRRRSLLHHPHRRRKPNPDAIVVPACPKEAPASFLQVPPYQSRRRRVLRPSRFGVRLRQPHWTSQLNFIFASRILYHISIN